jgi:hypothetical protein
MLGTTSFLKEKKKKKKVVSKVEVSKSHVFLIKYYPTYNRKRVEKRRLVYKKEPEMNSG